MIGIGIRAFFQKKATGFWANIKTVTMADIKGYNHTVGKLFIMYGVVFIALGMPLLGSQTIL